MDLNGDGIQDILLAVNEFDLKPQLGRLDGSNGICILDKGHGDFSNINSNLASFFLERKAAKSQFLQKLLS